MEYIVESFEHQVDAKNRIRIPAKLHGNLGKEFYLMPGTDGCISVYSKDALDGLIASLVDVRSGDGALLKAKRKVASVIRSVVEDEQGRTLLPQKLREYAGITKNVVSVGMIDHIEIWSKEKYDEIVEPMSVDEALKLLNL